MKYIVIDFSRRESGTFFLKLTWPSNPFFLRSIYSQNIHIKYLLRNVDQSVDCIATRKMNPGALLSFPPDSP